MSARRSAENFGRALARFEDFAGRDLSDPALATAVVKAFEYTFETAWKAVRGVVIEAGGDVALPRPSLAKGVEIGLIRREDADVWNGMAKDRNLAAHVYLPDVAEELVPRLVAQYLPAAKRLAAALEERQSSEEKAGDPLATGDE